MSNQNNDIFKSKVLGHPSGLFVLFFTEMWERFSYYGMRALLVLFLVSAFGLGGWNWPREQALALYGTYTALVYITPILGGYIADRMIGYRKAVIIGAVIMTLGHASMAIETHNIFLYIGIALLIIGNGFFKPNMTSIISHMYKDTPEKKDGAYTIFYMGVNAGAFLGILLCGYLGEKVGWSYGFGLAGVFMLLGMLQFHFSQNIFGDIGLKPVKALEGEEDARNKLEYDGDRLNPFTMLDKVLIAVSAIVGVVWVLNDPISKIAGPDYSILEINEIDYSNHFILFGLLVFLVLLISRILRYPKVTRDRMIAIVIFALMTVIFWMCFEQAGGSMTIFANDYTDRVMAGNYYYLFLVANILITVVPIGIITWVLFKLFKQTFKNYKLANTILGFSFVIIWGIVFWMINRDLNSTSYVVEYQAIRTELTADAYQKHEDRLETFKGKLAGDASFKKDIQEKVNGKEVTLAIDITPTKIKYNGEEIVHEHSDKLKRTERAAEQDKFDSVYVSKVLAIDNANNATVVYEEKGQEKELKMSDLYFETVLTEETDYANNENVIKKKTTVIEPVNLKEGQDVVALKAGSGLQYLTKQKEKNIRKASKKNGTNTDIVKASVVDIKDNELEIPATWFLILNSLFIIAFAPLFSKWWESKYNPSAAAKYGLGLVLLGIGFGALALGSTSIEPGAKTAAVSIIWLVLAYLFHTLGELCLSPVALSYVSKLVPGRMIAMMFGIWYIAVAIGNKLAGLLGGKIDAITESYSMQTFFLIFTVVPIGLGILGILMTRIVKKLMHGVK
jgi:POT family proton-dependent oligopeptide transporter